MDTNEWMWDNGTQQIGNHIPPLLFDTKEEIEERAKKWNTDNVRVSSTNDRLLERL